MQIITLLEAQSSAFWRRPIFLLFVMSAAMPIAFATWSALLNNFVVEVADFDGADIGMLHSVREIPGFLAVGVIALIIFVREQVIGLFALVLLGVATAMTGWFPQMGGILTLTLLSSIGFHYYETVNQSLQLQWIPKDSAPLVLGWLLAMGSAASLVAFGVIVVTWEWLELSYNVAYMVSGATTASIAVACIIIYPQFQSPTPQHKTMILRKRYWLYYALQFMAGARRQIFMVFAGFMMVERFGFAVHELTALYLINLTLNMLLGPLFGKVVAYFGERNTLVFEYSGLAIVFFAYGGIYMFGWGMVLAGALFVIDHLFFSLAFALKTYFQKIADPADIAPTAAVAFTINHIAAVGLPLLLGLVWLVSPGLVFVMAALMAIISFGLALLIPRHPVPGHETIFKK
ncbi:MAG: MFS transporter [Planktomarina sp.]|nr:MFS transporter [Planktomarina sp.]